MVGSRGAGGRGGSGARKSYFPSTPDFDAFVATLSFSANRRSTLQHRRDATRRLSRAARTLKNGAVNYHAPFGRHEPKERIPQNDARC